MPGTTFTQAATPFSTRASAMRSASATVATVDSATIGPFIRAPSRASAFHCALVSGTTDSRGWRTSGLSAKAASAADLGQGHRPGQPPGGSRSTTTRRGSFAFGSG